MYRLYSAIAAIAVALMLVAGGYAVAQDTGTPAAGGSDVAVCATPLADAQGTPGAMDTNMMATPETGSPVALETCATPIDPSPVVDEEASGGDPAGTTDQAATSVSVQFLDISFSETEITIPADTDVTFTFTNNGVLPHNFTIDDPQVFSGDLTGGQSSDVVVNLPAGTYEYYCSIPGHKEAGMVGTLTVE
jgi:plastocyanin